MIAVYREMAENISTVPGLDWKIWTENKDAGEAGGIYLFDNAAACQSFADEQIARLSGIPGISGIRTKQFDITVPLTEITRGPIG
ncbi:MAG: YdhR family protein [Acidobacteriota bacterium]|nr:MAG: YdhR family protein [Acidobacteriota bacterium]